MSRGKAKVNYLGREGLVSTSGESPDWGFLYEVSKIKHPHYNIGDRIVLPDGREFHYAKSAGICYAGQGCEFTQIGLAGSSLAVGQAIGDKQVTIVCASHSAIAEDEFRGGYIGIHYGSDNTTVQFRGVVGNPTSAENANITLYLDGPLTATLTTSTWTAELFQNPFATLQLGASVTNPKAGVPVTYVDAANKYFWVQTKAFCWSAPQLDALTGKETGACWRHDGSLDKTADGIGAGDGNVSTQYAGYRVVGTGDLVGPLFYLQG